MSLCTHHFVTNDDHSDECPAYFSLWFILIRYNDILFLSTETLRKYPLKAVVRRVTTKPYTVPNSNDITLDAGTLIVVPVHAFHHDSRYFASPEKFQPNRFPGQLSSAYIPYGSGPQSYIGESAPGRTQ